MRWQDKIDAATALMSWFQSQEIDEADACDIMCMTLASIIRTYGNNARERAQGVEVLKRSVLLMIKDMS